MGIVARWLVLIQQKLFTHESDSLGVKDIKIVYSFLPRIDSHIGKYLSRLKN